MSYGDDLTNPELREVLEINELVFAAARVRAVNFIPWLRFVPFLNRAVGETLAIRERRDKYLRLQLARVRAAMRAAGPFDVEAAENNRQLCFAAAVLAHQEAEGLGEIELMMMLSDLLLAGIDTSSTSVEWAALFLAMHPHVGYRCRCASLSVPAPSLPVCFTSVPTRSPPVSCLLCVAACSSSVPPSGSAPDPVATASAGRARCGGGRSSRARKRHCQLAVP